MTKRWIACCACAVLLASQLGGTCSGNKRSDDGCTATSGCSQAPLSSTDVETVIRQAYAEALANGVNDATIAVADRVGNVLAVFQMRPAADADPNTGVNYRASTIQSERSPLVTGGLEGLLVPAAVAAITKAGTGTYTASTGGAFTTRTANQITQENFNPGERNRLGGPLFGVQFSQLPCSDFSRRFPTDGAAGPKRLPLGFTTDAGGIPLYNTDGVPVGAVGIEIGLSPSALTPAPSAPFGSVTNDRDIFDEDTQLEERIAVAATRGFETPKRRRAVLIALDGRSLRFTDDDDVRSDPNSAPAFAALEGSLITVPGFYTAGAAPLAGTEFLTPASGYAAGTLSFQGQDLDVEFILTPGGALNAYPPEDSTSPAVGGGGLSLQEVTGILFETLRLAEDVRGQVRRPLGEPARINAAVVDAAGVILGFARSPDALVFGSDVSVQKARTAAFFSQGSAQANLNAAGFGSFVTATEDFLDDPTDAFTGSIAYSTTSIGGLSRPFFPNGINGNANGPLSNPFPDWSQFSTGLQLDAIAGGILRSLCTPAADPAYAEINALAGACPISPPTTCTDPTLSGVANGFQIFSGGVPIYRGNTLIGGLGISGDGAEQDDLITFLGMARSEAAFNDLLAQPVPPVGFATPAPSNAPKAIRSDHVTVDGEHLRWVGCPVSPFRNSGEQNACKGN